MKDITWIAIFLSLLFAVFSDELKRLKIIIFYRSGSLRKRLLFHREEIVAKYRECPIYRSNSNVLAIKSLLLSIMYFITFIAVTLTDIALTIHENQIEASNLSFTQSEYIIITIVLSSFSIFYLLSAGFRMNCHNKATQ